MKLFYTTIALWLSLTCVGQSLYLSTTSGDIHSLDITTCDLRLVCATGLGIGDLALSKEETLYAIIANGELYEIDTITGGSEFVYDFDGQAYNSLTIDEQGVFYASGSQGLLATYDTNTGIGGILGNMGARATGDLTFYQGDLYAAVREDRILKVNIESPSESEVVVDENILGDVWGIVSHSDGTCSDITAYMISGGLDQNGLPINSAIYGVDFELSIFIEICQLPLLITGGASSFEYLAADPLRIDSVHIVDAQCLQNNGLLEVYTEGGEGVVSYQLNNNMPQADYIFTNLFDGQYLVTVMDANNCNDTLTVAVETSGLPVQVELTSQPTVCGLMTGSISGSYSSDNLPLMYSIDDGVSFSSMLQFTNLAAGNYELLVEDATGCQTRTFVSVPAETAAGIVSVDVIPLACTGPSGIITVQANIGEVTYSLDAELYQSSNVFDVAVAGQYTVYIQDINGCTDQDTVTLSPLVIDTIGTVVATNTTCGLPNGQIEVEPTAGAVYSITESDYSSATMWTELSAGQYTVSMIDGGGCLTQRTAVLEASVPVEISEYQATNAECGQANGTATVSLSSAVSSLLEVYYNNDYLGGDLTITDLPAGMATIKVVESQDGCRDSIAVEIGQDECAFAVPNVFSPNGDGTNERLVIALHPDAQVRFADFFIYDRYGNLVSDISSAQISERELSWDGTFGGIAAESGVYTYSLTLVNPNGGVDHVLGDITLLR